MAFSIEEMQALQEQMSNQYAGTGLWQPNTEAYGKDKLLWLLGEVGEVIDLLKKKEPSELMTAGCVRQHLVEELADVLMYYNDVLLCYGISSEELEDTYRQKVARNLTRW